MTRISSIELAQTDPADQKPRVESRPPTRLARVVPPPWPANLVRI
ncbi:hypothetical protein ABTM90_19235 [Acinetobacter baumannii]